jgi:nucleoside 2-deoxyribosyltransferase
MVQSVRSLRLPLKVYIAASVTDKENARALRIKLGGIGVQCTSSWIDENNVTDPIENENRCRYLAKMDIEDIKKAQLIIFLSGTTKSPGKTTEIGYCLGTNKPVFFLGTVYSVFHWLDKIVRWESEEQLLAWLKENKEIVASLLA